MSPKRNDDRLPLNHALTYLPEFDIYVASTTSVAAVRDALGH
jgi:hypothetical protein